MSHDGRTRIGGGGTPHHPEQQSQLATQTATQTPQSSATSGGCNGSGNSDPLSPITLAVPRPEHTRKPNVYVDTPFQHRVLLSSVGVGREATHGGIRAPVDLPLVHNAPGRSSLSLLRPASKKCHDQHQSPTTTSHQLHKKRSSAQGSVVSAQPAAVSFTKAVQDDESIICTSCGRCRCSACTTPRPTGGVWLCSGKCHCSPVTAVDYASCLCCVKGVMYHCGKDFGDDLRSIDRPCGCGGPDACLRWTCLTAAAVPLPCLICYWPMTMVRRFLERTYQRFSTQGCRCEPSSRSPQVPRRLEPPPRPPPPEKRLLQDCI